MEFELISTNPAVKAIIAGTAPRAAQVAAASGILPLPQADLLELLVILASSGDAELSSASKETLLSIETSELRTAAEILETAPVILKYLSENSNLPAEIYEKVILNPKTPDSAILSLAKHTVRGDLLELISVNQQRLIRTPSLIEAILANSAGTPESERRATETRREFFEKERGAQQIADELRASGKEAAAEFIEKAEFAEDLADEEAAGKLTVEDAILIASHIEVPDAEYDDSWLSLAYIEEMYEETEEQRQANFNKVLGDLQVDEDDVSGERVSLIRKILTMNMKDRVKLAAKGDREARTILIRDANRIVCQAVVQNSRITEQEVEKISAMRTVPEDVLRQVAINKTWARNYTIIHNLARNPRMPLGSVMGILTRLQTRDLQAMNKNRNVSDAVRKQAFRIFTGRAGR
jgi:hypothetical protein